MTTQKENKTRTIHTRVKPSIWEKMEIMASEDGRTVTNLLERLVDMEWERRQKRRG